jgi:hypothetical protein
VCVCVAQAEVEAAREGSDAWNVAMKALETLHKSRKLVDQVSCRVMQGYSPTIKQPEEQTTQRVCASDACRCGHGPNNFADEVHDACASWTVTVMRRALRCVSNKQATTHLTQDKSKNDSHFDEVRCFGSHLGAKHSVFHSWHHLDS